MKLLALAFFCFIARSVQVSALSAQAARNNYCASPAVANCEPCRNRLCGSVTQWSEWSEFGSCSVTCGDGTMTRTRTCMFSAVDATCPGEASESQSCNLGGCKVDGNWSEWSDYGPCSATCGDQTFKTRLRICNDPAPLNGGMDCSGSGEEKLPCNQTSCPVNGNWGPWGDFTPCTHSCGAGATKSRLRACNSPSPGLGGNDCSGDAQEVIDCDIIPCPTEGSWSIWSPWTPCSATCGPSSGYRIRKRGCYLPVPCQGPNCQGDSTEIEACSPPIDCQGIITSPNYPNNYGEGIKTFNLTVPNANAKIEVMIEALDIECDCRNCILAGNCSASCDKFCDNCSFDSLTIYDGPTEQSKILTILCGHCIPQHRTFISSQSSMLVVFKSDSQNFFKGFNATYRYF